MWQREKGRENVKQLTGASHTKDDKRRKTWIDILRNNLALQPVQKDHRIVPHYSHPQENATLGKCLVIYEATKPRKLN